MLRSSGWHRLVCCALLLLLCLSGLGEGRPPGAHSRKAQLLEALRTGILSSLGMDREPRPAQKASEREMAKMYQLYSEKLEEMSGNSSRGGGDGTVLHPTTVELLPRSAGRRQWHRAVFHRNLQSELTLARAELKISRRILNKPTASQPDERREVKVQINGMNPISANVSESEDVTLDVRPEVETWMRAGGQTLVVDVGTTDGDEPSPAVSLTIGLARPRPPPRTRRSSKEDDCDERGWCCRKSVSVSFKDIGWTEWVVAPAEYTMHYCDGACPHNYKPASMHTQVKSRMHQLTKGGTPGPCCVPAAYEPMVLMHYDSRGKMKLTTFNDLIVTKCYCA